MSESERINGWTFEETVKTAENLMKEESNMFKWDVLRHLRDFAETYKDKVQQFEAIGTIERFRELTEKAEPKKPIIDDSGHEVYKLCPTCRAHLIGTICCGRCGQRIG